MAKVITPYFLSEYMMNQSMCIQVLSRNLPRHLALIVGTPHSCFEIQNSIQTTNNRANAQTRGSLEIITALRKSTENMLGNLKDIHIVRRRRTLLIRYCNTNLRKCPLLKIQLPVAFDGGVFGRTSKAHITGTFRHRPPTFVGKPLSSLVAIMASARRLRSNSRDTVLASC